MALFGPLFIFCVLCWGLAYYQASGLRWISLLGLSLAIAQWAELLSPPLSYSLGTVLILFTGMFTISPIRRFMVISPLFTVFKKTLPVMSATEREAIEAGDIWWEGELFKGQPDWDKLLALPKPTLTHEELAFLEHEVEHLSVLMNEWQVSHIDLDLPAAVWSYLKEKKFFGMIIPKKYGGLEFSALAHSTIVQKIAVNSFTAAITTMVPNSLGPAELLIQYGTEAQKQYYLPRLASGDEIPCFALTSSTAGSDAGAMIDYGRVCKGEFEGKEIIGIKLTWNKRYITLAPIATVLGLAFKLYDPDKILGKEEELGITLCLIPTSHPGVEIGQRHYPLHQTFMNGPTRGQAVFVPLDWIIGGPKMMGKGWRMLVECLSVGRGISLPALSTASAKICYRATGAYANIRKQFNTSIGKFEGVEEALAKIGGYTYLIEATRLLTLTALDQHIRPSIVTAIAKFHMTEMGRVIVNKAMDVHGGRAIMLGPNNYLAGCYESIPISITVEGANILTRNLIIFGQGAIRCHPFIQSEINAMSHCDPKIGLQDFDKIFFKHVRYSLSNIVKVLTQSLTGGIFCTTPKVSTFRRYYRQLGRMSTALAFVSDFSLIILGGKLKRRERLSARLGDVLSYLYQASAVLKYYYDVGNKNTEEDLAYANWALQTCLYHIQSAFLAFFNNFPNRFVGKLFKVMVFPFGRMYCQPTDSLEHTLARTMMIPSSFRDRLTQHGYLHRKKQSPLNHMDNTLAQMIATTEVSTKLEAAIKNGFIPSIDGMEAKIEQGIEKGILSRTEAETLLTFEKARIEALSVDEFSREQLVRN